MEIRIYNIGLELQGIIENQTSFIWTRKFQDAGKFELHAPLTKENVTLLRRGNVVSYRGAKEAGLIEYITMEAQGFNETIVAKGRFLTCIFDWMVTSAENTEGSSGNGIMTFSVYNKKPSVIFPAMLNTAYAPYILPENFEIGNITTGGKSITFQATAKNMLTYFGKVATACDVGFEIRPDVMARKFRLDVWEGVDRSKAQFDRPRIVFSEQLDNLTRVKYYENDQKYRNVCAVGGEGEGEQRKWTVAYNTDTIDSCFRMTSYNASGVSGSESDDYTELLRQSGLNYLKDKCPLNVSFECTVKTDGSFQYRKDYDIGDIVTIEKNSWGISKNLRITEVQENYKSDFAEVDLTLGSPLPSSIDWSDNQ